MYRIYYKRVSERCLVTQHHVDVTTKLFENIVRSEGFWIDSELKFIKNSLGASTLGNEYVLKHQIAKIVKL